MVKRRMMTDVYVEVHSLAYGGLEQEKKELLRFLEEVQNFRNFDWYNFRLRHVYEDFCSYCGSPWEEIIDNQHPNDAMAGMPACCSKAQKEFMDDRERDSNTDKPQLV